MRIRESRLQNGILGIQTGLSACYLPEYLMAGERGGMKIAFVLLLEIVCIRHEHENCIYLFST